MAPNKAAIEAALTELYAKSGSLTPSALVEAAKDPKSVFHPLFQWDDTQAAEQFRLQQARGILRTYKVQIKEWNSPYSGKLFNVRTQPRGEGEYHPVNVVVKVKPYFDDVLDRLRARFNSMKETLEELKFAAAKAGKKTKSAEIDALSKTVDGLMERLHEIAAD